MSDQGIPSGSYNYNYPPPNDYNPNNNMYPNEADVNYSSKSPPLNYQPTGTNVPASQNLYINPESNPDYQSSARPLPPPPPPNYPPQQYPPPTIGQQHPPPPMTSDPIISIPPPTVTAVSPMQPVQPVISAYEQPVVIQNHQVPISVNINEDEPEEECCCKKCCENCCHKDCWGKFFTCLTAFFACCLVILASGGRGGKRRSTGGRGTSRSSRPSGGRKGRR